MEIRPLRLELQEKANRELNEDPKRIQEAFDHIHDWLQRQPHLNIRNDDQTMIAFFRGCKWNLQIVKQKLDYFYTIKNVTPEFFGRRDPQSPEIQNVLKAEIVFPLPKVENYSGPVIIIYNLKNVNENETPFLATMRVFFMTIDILLREDDDFVVSGLSVLADHHQCPTSYYLQFTPTLIKNYLKCFQSAYPIRIKHFFMLNTLSAFEMVYNTVIKKFLNAKLGERIQVLNVSNSKKFFSEFPKNLLPEEYGGTNGTLQNAAERWKHKVESYREWFLEDGKYVTNEKLRMGNVNMLENNFGVDGTFRNLYIAGSGKIKLFTTEIMEIRPLQPKLQEIAIKELNEDPRRTEEAFDHIRDWLRKQPHLNVRNDDQIMIAFFRGCKWNLQIVKQKLDYFYSIKNQIPEFFRDRDPLSPVIQKALKAGIIFPLAKVENHLGPVIILCKLTNVDINEVPLVEMVKLLFMTMDILLREDDDFVVSGLSLVIDHDQCPSNYYLHLSPTVVKNVFICIQKAYPLRMKSVEIVNMWKAFEALYNTIVKPCVPEKLRSRFRVLNVPNSKKFFSEYPKNLLPEEYGGTNGTLKNAAVTTAIMEIRPLQPKLQEKAIEELNEDPRKTEEAFDRIRDWLRKQPHLNVRNDDQIMIAFFRGCKWHRQIVKQKLDYFHSIKNQIPEFFGNRDPFSPGIQNALKAGIVVPLPKVENHFGPVIILYKFTNVDVNETPLVETLKLFFMTMDILLREDDDFVVSGLSLVVDHDHCPTDYYLQFTPTAIKNYFICVQKAYPLRINSVEIVNTLKAFEVVYSTIVKPCMPEKLRSRVESYREWFLEDKEYFTNENLRIGSTSMLENDIGIDGTFRNLVID
ncbi:hypothetical protein RI129_009009 [Pyrocoelia pectoralis]|uniref:CRAL-TRIO domain-containing protein n=1 Tax=Pyrocoelia pectoralis TaxID=417401 RepID=A0AAN7ZGG4_9COLE